MTSPRLFPLASGTGIATVINGNIVILNAGANRVDACVQAFTTDANTQFRSFETPQEATEWATQTAATHQGRPNQYASIDYWEIRRGHSITISLTPEGYHKPDRHSIWVDSDHIPVMGLIEAFPTQEAALDWIRRIVDEEARHEDEYQEKLQRIQDALTALPSTTRPDKSEGDTP